MDPWFPCDNLTYERHVHTYIHINCNVFSNKLSSIYGNWPNIHKCLLYFPIYHVKFTVSGLIRVQQLHC